MIVNLLDTKIALLLLCSQRFFLLFFMGRASLRPSFLRISQYTVFAELLRQSSDLSVWMRRFTSPARDFWSAFDLRVSRLVCGSFTQSLVIYRRGFRCVARGPAMGRGARL